LGQCLCSGQQFNFQYTTSGEDLRAESASYVIRCHGETRSLFLVAIRKLMVRFRLTWDIGRSYQISGRYSVPLPEFGSGPLKYKHNVAAGFDYKYNDNALEFGVSRPGELYTM